MSRNKEELMELIARFRRQDCGDNSCIWKGNGPGGMRTNGGCRCRLGQSQVAMHGLFNLIEQVFQEDSND